MKNYCCPCCYSFPWLPPSLFPCMSQVSYKCHSFSFQPFFVGGQVWLAWAVSKQGFPSAFLHGLLCLSLQQPPHSLSSSIFFPPLQKDIHCQVNHRPGTFQGTFQSSWAAPLPLLQKPWSAPAHIFWSWGGRQKPLVLPAGRLLLPCGGDTVLFREPVVRLSLSARFRGVFFLLLFFLLSLSVSSPRLLPALCQGFDFCQLWPGPFSYLLSFQLCSGSALLVY